MFELKQNTCVSYKTKSWGKSIEERVKAFNYLECTASKVSHKLHVPKFVGRYCWKASTRISNNTFSAFKESRNFSELSTIGERHAMLCAIGLIAGMA